MPALQANKSRREQRKENKQLKKLRRIAYAAHRPVQDVLIEKIDSGVNKKKRAKKSKAERRANRAMRDSASNAGLDFKEVKKITKGVGSAAEEVEQFQKEVRKMKRQREKELLHEDEKEVKKYSKLLGYNKRKSEKQPKIFEAEGLDGLLGFLDAKDKSAYEERGDDDLIEDCTLEDDEIDKVNLSEDEENAEGEMNEQDDDEEEGDSAEDEQAEEESIGDEDDLYNEDDDEIDKVQAPKEDIYGRTIDSKTGRLIPFDPAGARRKLDELSARTDGGEGRLKVDKLITGLLNRLSESSAVKSAKDLKALYAEHSKNYVKSAFSNCLLTLIRNPFPLPEAFMCSYGLFLGLVHGLCSSEISAFFVEQFLVDFVAHIGVNTGDKSVHNEAIFVAQLLNFRIVKAGVIYDVLQRLADALDFGSVQYIIEILKYAYRPLKKSGGAKLVDFIQALCVRLQAPEFASGRGKFLAEQVGTFKKGVPTSFDTTVLDRHISIFHGLTKKEKFEHELGMGLEDLLQAEERGRWWIVGSSFQPGNLAPISEISKQNTSKRFGAEVIDLAKKAGMNTETRRDIFCSIVTAEDEDEAFENLARLSLLDKQERQIIHVLVYMLFKEKAYNEFYFVLIKRFCELDRRFVLTTQYALWDKLKELENVSARERGHLARLIAALIVARCLPMTVLKVIEWGALTSAATATAKKIFEHIAQAPQSILNKIFESVVDARKNRLLSDGIRIFLQMHFENVAAFVHIENMFATFSG